MRVANTRRLPLAGKALGVLLFVVGAVLGVGATPAIAYECVPCPVSCNPTNPNCNPPPGCKTPPWDPQCKHIATTGEDAVPAELWLTGAAR